MRVLGFQNYIFTVTGKIFEILGLASDRIFALKERGMKEYPYDKSQ